MNFLSNDDDTIEATALTWIAHGGDSEGMEYFWRKLRDKIRDIENHAKQTEEKE